MTSFCVCVQEILSFSNDKYRMTTYNIVRISDNLKVDYAQLTGDLAPTQVAAILFKIFSSDEPLDRLFAATDTIDDLSGMTIAAARWTGASIETADFANFYGVWHVHDGTMYGNPYSPMTQDRLIAQAQSEGLAMGLNINNYLLNGDNINGPAKT